MGVLGGAISSPNYLQGLQGLSQGQQNAQSQALQQALQNQAWTQQITQAPDPRSWPAISVSGIEAKVRHKIKDAIEQLPMRICARIVHIQFYPEHPEHPKGGMRFVVVFDNQHHIDFTDVDEFPAPEHIARIALECP